MYRAKRLASSRPGMRVLFVSGYADQDTAELVLSEAKIGYLQKPFGPLDLARKVSEMISRRLPADRASRCRSETLRGNGTVSPEKKNCGKMRRSEAAAVLSIDRTTLYAKIRY